MYYIIKKIGIGIVLVFTVSILVFSILYMMPGTPIEIMADNKVSEQKQAEMVKAYGYDQPLHIQYIRWMKRIVIDHDFGDSIRYKVPVSDLLKKRIPRSVALCGCSLAIEMLVSIPLGLLCAVKKGKPIDRLTIGTSAIVASIPNYLLCAVLILVFSVLLKWFPISGFGGPQYFVLPIFALTAGTVSDSVRVARSEVLSMLNEKYVTTALAKGLPYEKVLTRHVLRNSLIMITVSVFMSLPWLVAGSVVVEKSFGIPGIGDLLLTSIEIQDFPVVQAVLLIIATLTVVCNIFSDIVVAILDPRIRISIDEGGRQ